MNFEKLKKLKSFDGCFVCGKDNEKGLQLDFYYDDESKKVFCRFSPCVHFVGFESFIHGGIITSVLDEIMALSAMMHSKEVCLTESICVKFILPIMPSNDYIVEGFVERTEEKKLFLKSEVKTHNGKTAAQAESVFSIVKGRRADMIKKKSQFWR